MNMPDAIFGKNADAILQYSIISADSVQTAFENTIQPDPGEGSGAEQGIAATNFVIQRYLSTDTDETNTRAKNFVRHDANLAVIVVTDADETLESNTQKLVPFAIDPPVGDVQFRVAIAPRGDSSLFTVFRRSTASKMPPF
jgi:hypothetical protein